MGFRVEMNRRPLGTCATLYGPAKTHAHVGHRHAHVGHKHAVHGHTHGVPSSCYSKDVNLCKLILTQITPHEVMHSHAHVVHGHAHTHVGHKDVNLCKLIFDTNHSLVALAMWGDRM